MSTQEDLRTQSDREPVARGPGESADLDGPAAPTKLRRVGRTLRRRSPWLLVLALVCAAVAAYFVVLQRDSSQSAPTESGEAGTLTEAAAFRDLAEQESFEGTLGYEGATKLANQGSGIVTQLATEGSSVVAGEALYSLDGVPVTLMDGMVPAWRALGIALEDEALVNQLAGTITQLSAEGKTRVAGEVLYRVDGEPVVLMEGTVAASRALGLTLDDAPVVNQLSGTITQLSAESKTRSAGDVLYTVDQQPVVLMDGRVPAWRSLFLGVAKGADVRQLEENLVALGYDPDGDIVVNREFSYATQRAVLRWQDDLGITEDGIVGFGDVVFLEGEQKVVAQTSVSSAAGTSAVGIGSAVQPGSEILRVAARSALEPGPDVRQLEENLVALGYDPGGKIKVDARFNRSTEAAVERWQRDIGAGVDGVIDLGEVVFLPEAQRIVAQASDNSGATVGVGSTVQPGGEILRVAPLSNVPDPGQDILQLEENLVALGHDADGALVVDLEFDAATEAAVRSWQSVVGLEEDGVIELGEVVFLPGPQRVEAQLTAVGSAMQPGAQVLALTSDKQVVTLDLDADRQDLLAEGSSLMVDLPDGSTSEGIVTGISSVVTQPSQSADGTAAEPTVEVTIELVGAITVELAQAPVDVLITTDSRSGVLTVPLTALIALAGGGFAVEVIDGQTTKLVAVDPGLFTTGYVEVMNTTLKPGNEVVLPQG